MKPEHQLAALQRIKDDLAVIEANTEWLPNCAATIAIKAIAKQAYLDAFNLHNDLELSLEESRKAETKQ